MFEVENSCETFAVGLSGGSFNWPWAFAAIAAPMNKMERKKCFMSFCFLGGKVQKKIEIYSPRN
jgi:hypothetical protein